MENTSGISTLSTRILFFTGKGQVGNEEDVASLRDRRMDGAARQASLCS